MTLTIYAPNIPSTPGEYATLLREAKQEVRMFIRANLPDQRLSEVYAFNQDDRMTYRKACACLLGVTGSTVLHDDFLLCPDGNHYHYDRVLREIPHANAAELGYNILGYSPDGNHWNVLRKRRLSAILRAEIRRRDRLHEAGRLAQEELVEVTA